ncbi:MAG: hypothetical protein ACKOXB_05730 [Flavobacteriales bacterium]
MQSKCFNELIEQNQIYLYLTEKLDIPKHLLKEKIGRVCGQMNLNHQLIEAILKSYDDNYDFPYAEFNTFSAEEIINYLEVTHRYYLMKKLPEMEQTVFQVFNKYNESHKLLSLLCLFFADYKKKLEEHIRFEEEKLFPYIKSLSQLNNQSSPEAINAVLDSFSLQEFIVNHNKVEDDLQEVRNIILKYKAEKSTPLPYRIFLTQLQNFELELSRHALIEDEILLPRMLQKEASLQTKRRASI